MSKANTNLQKFELNKDDLANIYGRLKVADYLTLLTNADCYTYIREVVMQRLGVPISWGIVHSPDWKIITFIAPSDVKYADAASREEKETGRVPEAMEIKK